MTAVNVKLVLAEAINILKKGEEREGITDKELEKMIRSHQKNHDFPKIKRMYSAAYDTYIRGLELMNFCRRSGIDNGDDELARFGAEKMKLYMDRCEKLRTKESNVLTSVGQADSGESVLKEGYSFGDVLFSHKKTEGFKGSNPITYEGKLDDGSYFLQVKNYDDYSVAAPTIRIQLQITGRDGRQLRQQKVIPSMTCWGKYIGVVLSGHINLKIISDAMVRQSHVEVTLSQLIPPQEAAELKDKLSNHKLDTSWVDNLPALPNAPPAMGEFPQIPQNRPPQAQASPPQGGGGFPNDGPPPGYGAGYYPTDGPEQGVPDNNNYGFGLIMPQGPPDDGQPRGGNMPPAEPLGGTGQQHPGSPFGLEGLSVPSHGLSGRTPNPTEHQFQQQNSADSDGMDTLANLQVPYRKKTPVQKPQGSGFEGNERGVPSQAQQPPQQQQQQPSSSSSAKKELEPAIAPKDETLQQRLDRVKRIFNSYPSQAQFGDATKLTAEERTLLDHVRDLPGPTDIGGDFEVADIGEMDLGEMEGGDFTQ